MIYQPPKLQEADLHVFSLISEQRERLRLFTQSIPKRWLGQLRRSTFARAIQGSNTIEGYTATLDTALAAAEDEEPLNEKDETWFALAGYRAAMTYIMQAAQDPFFEFNKQFLKSLHFMMVGYHIAKYPGQWRPGSVFVVNSQTGQTVYNPPSAEVVNSLIEELVEYLKTDKDENRIVQAAMAHLNLTMIHPFIDGNGRLARALQTLVIARDGILHSVFSSIEEWLGRNTQEYYQILAETGEGIWNPSKSALPWVRFCFKAHYQQAATLIRRNEECELLYEKILLIIQREKLPERAWFPLFDATLGYRVMNQRYRRDSDISEFIASRDLRKMSQLNLLEPQGEKRGRVYLAGTELRSLRKSLRIHRPLDDPYIIARLGHKTALDLIDNGPRLPGL